MLSLPPHLVWLLCACSDLISSLHRQVQDRERIKTRGISMVIEIPKGYPLPKTDITHKPKAANATPKDTCQSHISTPTPQKPPERYPQWKLPENIRIKLPPHNSSGRPKTPHIQPPPFQPLYLLDGPTTIEQQWQAQITT